MKTGFVAGLGVVYAVALFTVPALVAGVTAVTVIATVWLRRKGIR